MVRLKSKEDIEVLKAGGAILAAILDDVEKLAIPGNTTLDIDDRAMELMEEFGVEPMTLGYHAQFAPRPYPAATCVSVNDVIVHGIPNETPITFEDGDIVSIDIVIAYNGMVVDSARTVAVGAPSPEVKGLIHVTRMALDAGIKAAQNGNYTSDIGKAIAASVPKGYGIIEVFCGHGVGFEIHEDPLVPNFVTTEKGEKLIPGLVIAIEPMITLGSKEVEILSDGYTAITKDGSLAAHMEHTVAITEKGPVVLTRSARG